MALISQAVPNLINGVSQQPPSLRLNTQAELQENGLSSVVNGLSKRPSTQHVANLGSITNLDKAFIHTIRRDENEFYSMVIDTAGTIRVYDKVGTARTVTNNASNYLTGLTNPSEELAAVSIADTTFIVNKTTVVGKDTTTSPVRNPEALVFVKQADYSSTYRLKLTKGSSTSTIEFATKSSTQSSTGLTQNAERGASTDLIAENLGTFSATAVNVNYYDNIVNGSAVTGLTVDVIGSVVHIYSNDSTDFTIEVGDSHGGDHLLLFKGSTGNFKKLPAEAPEDFVIEVAGDNQKAQDDYYVKFNGGVWKETVEPNILTELDASTMPHKLQKDSSANFTFEEQSYKERRIGSDVTNPFPSFVDYTIADIFFHRNRLGILADENVIFSRAGEFVDFDFFRKSALTIVDSDPIDVSVSSNKVSILKHAVPFNEALLLFSDLTQFKVTGSPVLSPETINVSNTTEFEASLRAKPAQSGKYVYFASKRGAWSGMWEYFVDSDTDTNDASEITSHVPEYIDGEITSIQASSNEDMLIVKSSNDPQSVYVYRYYWQGREKLQASWSKWVFSGDVIGFSFNLADIYLLIKRGNNLFLERINLSVDEASTYTDGGFSVHLDRRVILQTGGLTAVPYTDSNTIYVTEDGGTLPVSGVAAKLAAGEVVFAGIPFTFKYQFSEPVAKINNTPVTRADLRIRNWSVSYNDTGFFSIKTTPARRTTYSRTFTGRIIGGAANLLNKAAIDSGSYEFGVVGNSDTKVVIESDSHLPCAFQSAEWEGFYVLRSRRM
ncbi:hypothetical protein [Alteromonas sp.]|uniref:phage nozzle protein n=1 Tax=Alteromonas sp. TaxID=232 RepID=UPI000C58A3A1|nr:hypothetical protein [Alteromonas sp.]MAI39625.1 hypothetical protein [Alteromonas sp.]|tara:strand:- start:14451 stop:16787 length:2337 start_codon:yes stop_codon:yes gene_type:complete